MPSADTARSRDNAEEGGTLVVLHSAATDDLVLGGHLVAVLFAAASPMDVTEAARILDVSVQHLDVVLERVREKPPLGLAVQRFEDRLQLTTAPGAARVMERFLGSPPPVRLSRAALEALAVVAYRQPVTRGDIDAVRGVNSDSAVATLLSRNLVAEVGRRETVGRPALLAVTTDCLQYLGVTSLADLPPLPDGSRPSAAPDADPSAQTSPAAEPGMGGAGQMRADHAAERVVEVGADRLVPSAADTAEGASRVTLASVEPEVIART